MSTTTPALSRRGSTVFEPVRRLARRISLSIMSPRADDASRPSSVASSHAHFEQAARPRSRLARLRRNTVDEGAQRRVSVIVPDVAEEPEPDVLMRSSTPRGGAAPRRKGPDALAGVREGVREEGTALRIPWAPPGARMFRQVSGGRQTEYDITPLVQGAKVNELWFPTGDTLIFLCSNAEAHRYAPSFRLSSSTLRRKSEFFSTALSDRWQEGTSAHRQLLASEAAQYILYFPPWEDDLEATVDTRKCASESDFHDLCRQLVATRNFFAYLFGRACVGLQPPNSGGLLSDFMDRMEMYILGPNLDVAGRPSRAQSLQDLEHWIRSKEIDDARNSPQRLVDILLIAERYQWVDIFTEAFVHAAGLYDSLLFLPEYALLPPATRQLLERASFAVKSRVRASLSAISTMTFPILTPARHTRRTRGADRARAEPLEPPTAWYNAYKALQKATIKHYTALFRSWPPRRFTRGMALQMHADFSALYDLLADTHAPANTTDEYRKLLARVLAIFTHAAEHTSPLPHAFPRLPQLPPEDSPAWNRKQSREAISVVLLDSYNTPTRAAAGNRLVDAFKEHERAYGAGRTVTKSVEAREGRWCFVYAVLATLECVLGRGREWEGLRYAWGVEYWLCAELRGVGGVVRRVPVVREMGEKEVGGRKEVGLGEAERKELGMTVGEGRDEGRRVRTEVATATAAVTGGAAPVRSVFGG
ncbi:hypothetical protein EDC01DRAFT_747332 [Geopyxis carbonaria]|nr:hypothetical protein EDC01DRAFT_747332 [Geopyxis carbonaria]